MTLSTFQNPADTSAVVSPAKHPRRPSIGDALTIRGQTLALVAARPGSYERGPGTARGTRAARFTEKSNRRHRVRGVKVPLDPEV